jgi:c-di-GMP-binding flagellar brake protein YcgR
MLQQSARVKIPNHSQTIENDKRAAHRKQLDGRAKVLLDGHSVSAATRDVAPGGMAIVTTEAMQPGQSCVVAFVLPSKGGVRPVSASATVRHSAKRSGSGYAAGLQFTDIDSMSAWIIWEFAALRSPVRTFVKASRARLALNALPSVR